MSKIKLSKVFLKDPVALAGTLTSRNLEIPEEEVQGRGHIGISKILTMELDDKTGLIELTHRHMKGKKAYIPLNSGNVLSFELASDEEMIEGKSAKAKEDADAKAKSDAEKAMVQRQEDEAAAVQKEADDRRAEALKKIEADQKAAAKEATAEDRELKAAQAKEQAKARKKAQDDRAKQRKKDIASKGKALANR